MDGRDTGPATRREGPPAAPAPDLVRGQLARMLGSRTFANAPSLSRFLAHIVEHILQGQPDNLKEYAIGVDVFDRGPSFDPRTDTIVRVQARRLRTKIEEYYESEGRDDGILIELGKGRYVPEFRIRRRDPVGRWGHGVADIRPLRGRTDSGEVTESAAAVADAAVVEPESPVRGARVRAFHVASALIVTAAAAVGAWWLLRSETARPTTYPSEYTQITDFTDSVTAPSLSPDGRMVTFIRGNEWFLSRGQIYVKLLPDGEPRQLTNTRNLKFSPTFTPDGSQISFSQDDTPSNGWNTWTVSILGDEPSAFLPNASGLVWLDRQHVLFSEARKPAPHMGLVTTTVSRSGRREVYVPIHQRGMAHFSFPSPDRRWILVVEMDGTGSFDRCRLVPFDGSSGGHHVGPEGKCTAAAWSPDGKWMYFSAEVGRQSHLWRQSLSGGSPEQITFGPTDEEGVTVAPDGKSLITAIGRRQGAIWIHDSAGDRPLSTSGLAFDPRLSADGRRVYFLLQPSPDSSSSELRAVDLMSGRESRLVEGIIRPPDIEGVQYDVSPDDREVVYATRGATGEREIWLAPLDRSAPPRRIAQDAAFPSFGRDDDLFWVAVEERSSSLLRTRKDGSGRQKIPHHGSVVNRAGVSPDGQWVVVFAPAAENEGTATLALPVGGGAPRRICNRLCWAWWSSDRTFMFVNVFYPARTLVLPIASGQVFPDLPPEGLDGPAERLSIPGMRVIQQPMAIPTLDPSSYVFEKREVQRNLYRVPVH